MPNNNPETQRQQLKADCSTCFALCCVALSFARSADFALNKPAGEPCVNLKADFSCGIHAQLRSSGFKGCTVFDCFGAGQKVSQQSFGGVSWQANPSVRDQMFAVFPLMRDLHELLWYLSEARMRDLAPALAAEIERLAAETTELTNLQTSLLLDVDIRAHHASVARLLDLVSSEVRSRVTRPCTPSGRTRDVAARAELIGRDLSGTNLRGATLRGALLIAADLSGADLSGADLIGADLRDAKLHGANLSDAQFLTQQQLNSAHGDTTTLIPAALERPDHWRWARV